jgi:uncharacterized protein with PIN domain
VSDYEYSEETKKYIIDQLNEEYRRCPHCGEIAVEIACSSKHYPQLGFSAFCTNCHKVGAWHWQSFDFDYAETEARRLLKEMV